METQFNGGQNDLFIAVKSESDALGRVACGSGVDLIFQFYLEMRGDGIKRCRKMKRRHRARLDSIERKHDMVRRCDDVGRRRGGTREETTSVRLT
jgi:hypothetical protein